MKECPVVMLCGSTRLSEKLVQRLVNLRSLFGDQVWPDMMLDDMSDDYDQPGQKSKPEWGINYTKKNMPLMDPYRIENYFKDTD